MIAAPNPRDEAPVRPNPRARAPYPEPGPHAHRADPRVYAGRYPIRTHRTMAQVMADEAAGVVSSSFHSSTHTPERQHDHVG